MWFMVDERGDLIGGCTQRVKSSFVTLAKRRKDSGPIQGVICLEGGVVQGGGVCGRVMPYVFGKIGKQRPKRWV